MIIAIRANTSHPNIVLPRLYLPAIRSAQRLLDWPDDLRIQPGRIHYRAILPVALVTENRVKIPYPHSLRIAPWRRVTRNLRPIVRPGWCVLDLEINQRRTLVGFALAVDCIQAIRKY